MSQDHLKAFYESHDEDARLRSRHGMVEFLTTMRYIERYLEPDDKILEIGAGTGRYAHALMDGLPVTRLHFVGTDMAAGYMSGAIDQMDEELYELYLRYHFAVCERPDLVGASNHFLDIFRKI